MTAGNLSQWYSETVELTLTVAELVDLIEAGAISSKLTDYEPAIVGELRDLFTRMAQSINEAADEV